MISKTISDIGLKLSLMYNSAKIISEDYAKSIVHGILGWEGNIAGFVVALISSVIIGIVIMLYMVNAAKEAAGNDTTALAQIDKITNIAYIALFFAGFVGFVVAAKYILDIISGGNKGGGGM
ncbi:hypothetical protein ACO3UB_08430 (plasmid) [Methanocaldococcus sp. 16A]